MQMKILTKTKIIASILWLLCSPSIFAIDFAPRMQPFELNITNDILLGIAGAGLSGSALVCDDFLHIKRHQYVKGSLLKSDVPYFDQIFMCRYSKPIHWISNGTVAFSLIAPLAFAAITPSDEWLTIGTMYAETFLIANGIKEWIKIGIDRARPYMYYDNYPRKKVEQGDWDCSFPSGHTTWAFASAAFASYVFFRYFPDSKWNKTVIFASFGIAFLTGALRMMSGNHFFSDVFAGALLGTGIGLLVPYMHTKTFYARFKKNDKIEASVSPVGFAIKYSF